MHEIFSLHDFKPQIQVSSLSQRLVPPPRFATATLESYIADHAHPSQQAAKEYLRAFIHRLNRQRNGLGKLLKSFGASPILGIYLDGAFGVGKTHLLAAAHSAFEGKKYYLSFTELMYLIGYLGLERAAAELSTANLIAIDEFELDDPGNTTMAIGFLQRIFARNIAVITTSNTPPSRLGEGRFAVQDFQREISALSSQFYVLRIDGNDYRQRRVTSASASHSTWHLSGLRKFFSDYHVEHGRKKAYFNADELLHMLRTFHPMHYLELAETLGAVFIEDLWQLHDQFDALRFVYFIDKLYDNQSKLFASATIPIEELFPKEFYKSAYAKKYLRCLSRLKEMCST
ncbi:MAG: cell division protein ZapE [Candidatus Thermochlorobacter sp.]